MARDYFEGRGYRVLRQNARFFGTEIDLFLQSPEGIEIMVEIKSLSNPDHWHHRLSQKQKQRLLRVHSQWVGRWGRPLGLVLALVTPERQVILVPILGKR